MSTDHQPAVDGYDDHCLIHHFIRAHGRVPSADELRALREQGTVPDEQPRQGGGVSRTPAPGLRRELARLMHRL